MTSTHESASALFENAGDDHDDFFASLDPSGEVQDVHGDDRPIPVSSQESPPMPDATFSPEIHHHSSAETSFYGSTNEYITSQGASANDYDPENSSSLEYAYDPATYNNAYQLSSQNEPPSSSASWYSPAHQKQSYAVPSTRSYAHDPSYTPSYASPSPYDSYAPPMTGGAQHESTLSPSQMQVHDAPSAFTNPFPPPPKNSPVPDVSSFRSTSKSAYDPPLPTKRPSKMRQKVANSSQYPGQRATTSVSSPPLPPAPSYSPGGELLNTAYPNDPAGFKPEMNGYAPFSGLPSNDVPMNPPHGQDYYSQGHSEWPNHSGASDPDYPISDHKYQRLPVDFPVANHSFIDPSTDQLNTPHAEIPGAISGYSQVRVMDQGFQRPPQADESSYFTRGESEDTSQVFQHHEPSEALDDETNLWTENAYSVADDSQPVVPESETTHTPNDLAQDHTSVPAPLYDPYAPAPSKVTAVTSPPYDVPPDNLTSPVGVQFVAVAPSPQQYAPSPSLLGSNDPLQRTSARTPIFSFGFGGRVVSCFHLAQTNSGGFDVAMSSQEAKNVRLRLLHNVLPESISEGSGSQGYFPGPLFADPGSVSTGIISTGVAAAIKSKKTAVLQYLNTRLEEMEKGIGHQSHGSLSRQRMEDKVKLIQLLKVLVDNDGSLGGNPKAEAAIREALCPQMSGGLTFNAISMPVNEHPVTSSTVNLSALNRLEEFLLAGERRHAYHYALDEKLWGHAMLIARSLDTEAWMDVVHAFIKSELENIQVPGTDSPVTGLESLRIAYGLFGGMGASSLQTCASLSGKNNSISGVSAMTPKTPNFIPPMTLNPETLNQWSKIASVSFSNPIQGSSATLTSLGDHLSMNNRIEAAHCCYLLSPQTSALGGAGQPSSKAVLLGSPDPSSYTVFDKDVDGFIFTEVAEFALSLAGQQKSQEAFSGLSHLQPYRLIRAYNLADMGHTAVAIRYCEAIGTSLRMYNKPSPYHTQCFLERLKELSDRLAGVPLQEKSKSWAIGRVAKPSLDSLGGWLEGRITKFIAGDGETPTAAEHSNQSYRNAPYSGAFSGYSTISSAHTSQCPSPSPSLHYTSNSHSMAQSLPMRPPSVNRMVNIHRASSAIDGVMGKRAPSPIARIASANPSTLPASASTLMDDSAVLFDSTIPKLSGNWWEKDETVSQTPIAATFYQVDQVESKEGLTSLMDGGEISFASSRGNPVLQQTAEDEDDLGFGNTKPKSEKTGHDTDDQSTKPPMQVAKTQEDKSSTIKPAASSSWLGWIWKRGEPQSGKAVQAKLGEEKSTFYYDKELKRWVNSKAPSQETLSSLPPPPPSRQATAPPDTAPAFKSEFGKVDPPQASNGPTRAASAAPPPRAKMSATPDGTTGSMPPPAGTPPPSRPSTRASAKRNIRSRYVDVFQQENLGN